MSLQRRQWFENLQRSLNEAGFDTGSGGGGIPSLENPKQPQEPGDPEHATQDPPEDIESWTEGLGMLYHLLWWLINKDTLGGLLNDDWLGRWISGAPATPDCTPAECPQEWMDWQEEVIQFILDALADAYNDWLEANPGGSIWDFIWEQFG